MSPLIIGVLVMISTIVVLATGVPVAFGLGLVAISFLLIFEGPGTLDVLADTFFEGLAEFSLVSIPMFIVMGVAIAVSPAGKDLYEVLDRWLHRVPGGLIIYDSSLINHAPQRNDVEIMAIPATQMADTLGNTRAANMILLGAYIHYAGVLKKETVINALPNFIKRRNLVPLNALAIEKGIEFAKENYSST